MSKLQQTNYCGTKGWQWEDSPIFIGDNGRKWAIDYGRTLQCLKDLEDYAKMCQQQIDSKIRLEQLEKLKGKRWRFHWLNGQTEDGVGNTVEAAFTRLGYGAGALGALDYYEEVK